MAEIQNDPVASVIEDLYPLAQVAKILRCSRKSVNRLISSGRLNAVRWGRSYSSDARTFSDSSETRLFLPEIVNSENTRVTIY